MFILQGGFNQSSSDALDATVGFLGQVAIDADSADGDRYVKLASGWIQVTSGGASVPITITADDISDAGATGKAVLRSADQATARTAIGALAANGTAANATKLVTPRAINGHNFDGSAPVTIAPDDLTTAADVIAAGGHLTIPAGTGIQAALKLLADAVDPGST